MFVAAACSTATIDTSYRAPAAPTLTNVATLSPSPNASTRRAAEDALARQLSHHGVHAVPAYTILGDQELGDRNYVATVLASRGFDGVVAMRTVSATQTQELYPGRDPGFEDPWTNTWGTVETTTEVQIEINAYSLPSKKLVWTGMSKATSPDGAHAAIADVSRVAGDKLAEEHVVTAAQMASR